MSKKLSEMTLEELWQLFPVILSEHKPYWADWYSEEVESLQKVLPKGIGFHHIGSTAVNGIMAKPVIDILISVPSNAAMEQTSKILQNVGYLVMSTDENRISLNKGYTENGYAEKVFHVHLRINGDTDEIYFRDYLNAHPETAKEYERLKLQLCGRYKHDRDAYTQAKTDFVRKYTQLAKKDDSFLIHDTKTTDSD